MESKRRVISLLVDNQSGVLARVSNLFCRRGFNIDSLTVSATNDPAVSRITVTITSDEKALSQLILQTERLEVTRQVFVLDHENSLERELLLLKVAADVHNRSELREIASIYKAKIIDLSPDSMVLELTGRIQCNESQTLGQLNEAGFGILHRFEFDVQEALTSGKLVRVLPDWHLPEVNLYAVTSSREAQPAKVRHAIEAVRRYLAQYQGSAVRVFG